MRKYCGFQKLAGLIGLAATALVTLAWPGSSQANEKLIVHEWGTFTALQDEKGDALPGINIDDEPLPAFCHNLNPFVLQESRALPQIMKKGAPERHPYVTLRLETPVLYFHPPAGQKLPFSIDVDVLFHGGWLTEFYPHAEPDAPGLKEDEFNFGPISAGTVGSLKWHNVQVGTTGDGPETSAHIWLAPRKVNAATITVAPQTPRDSGSETEKFLFYRGVGNRPVPLRVEFDEANQQLGIHSQCADVLSGAESAKIEGIWIVHSRADGRVAWRAIDPLVVSRDPIALLALQSTHFVAEDYAEDHLQTLKKAMHVELVKNGLYEDEATAMLETWQRAYFQSPGLRVFFVVPRVWTDAVLPLKLSQPAELQRVMMGRVELISPEQRGLLKKLAATEVSDPAWVSAIRGSPNANKFFSGQSDFGDLGVKIPADFQTYLDLGRFRNALVLAEEKVRPTPQLQRFISMYGLSAQQPK